MPVVLFHAELPGFSGGYIGVDVFFVISGFLISSIIWRELGQGSFSLLRFYERRARRILPALLAVLLFCFVAGYWVLPPTPYDELGDGALAVLGFFSNVWFWLDTDYFSEPSEYNALLHTWSLAIEEQFYLGFPLLLMFIGPRRLKAVIVIAVIALFSFVLAELASKSVPSANFYLLPFRAWELLVGSLLALGQQHYLVSRPHGLFNEGLGIAGLLAILAAIATLDSTTPFPGVYALLPVLGSAAIILSGTATTLTSRLLSNRLLVFIGLTSYSVYLWHQPFLVFRRFLFEPSAAVTLITVCLAFVAGYLSWRFVEQPFRSRSRFDQRRIFTLSAVGMVTIGLLAGATTVIDGFPERAKGLQQESLVLYDRKYERKQSWGLVNAARKRAAADSPIVIVGDSHAKDLYNALVLGGCLEPTDAAPLIAARLCPAQRLGQSENTCLDTFDFPGQPLFDATKVILAPSWQPGQVAALPSLLAELHDRDIPTAVVLGTPVFNDVLLHMQIAAWGGAERYARELMKVQDGLDVEAMERTDKRLRAAATSNGAQVISRYDLVCPNDECEIFTAEGTPLLNDHAHWSMTGAALFGERACKDPALFDFLGR